MLKQVIVLFAILLAIEVNSTSVKNAKLAQIDPYAMIDEARDQLVELRQLVQGAIITADDNLVTLNSNLLTYSVDTITAGVTAVQLESVTIQGMVDNIKNFATDAGVNISVCLQDRVEYLDALPAYIIYQLNDCDNEPLQEGSVVVNDARYVVDVTITKVNNLEYQLGLCTTGSILCISPIATDIQLQMIQLPQKISTEVNKASDLLESPRIAIQGCTNVKVGDYLSDATSMVDDIGSCVDFILGSL